MQLLVVSVLAAALILTNAPRALAAGATLYVDPGTSVAEADTIGTSLRLSADDNKITFVNFNVIYDSSKLEFTGTDQNGSPFSNTRGGGRGGSINVAAGSMDDRVSGDVPVIGLKFRIIDRTGSTTLSINNAGVYNDMYINVASSTSGAVYDFDAIGPSDQSPDQQTPAITPAPTVTVAPSSVPARPTEMPAPKRTKTVADAAGVPPANQNSTVLSAPEIEVPIANSVAPKDEFPDQKGSVFIAEKPRQQQPTSLVDSYWLAAAGAIGFLVTMFVIWRRYASRFTRRAYEVIPPLASMWPTGTDELDVNNSEPAIPFIPVAQPNAISISEAEETDQSWKYDINSPLMNTL